MVSLRASSGGPLSNIHRLIHHHPPVGSARLLHRRTWRLRLVDPGWSTWICCGSRGDLRRRDCHPLRGAWRSRPSAVFQASRASSGCPARTSLLLPPVGFPSRRPRAPLGWPTQPRRPPSTLTSKYPLRRSPTSAREVQGHSRSLASESARLLGHRARPTAPDQGPRGRARSPITALSAGLLPSLHVRATDAARRTDRPWLGEPLVPHDSPPGEDGYFA
jgi:hypothetical protein